MVRRGITFTISLNDGCFQVEIKRGVSYDDILPNPTMIDVYKKNAADLQLLETEMTRTRGGSTDMGNVSYVVPSIHPLFYVGSDAVIHTRPMTDAAGK